MGVLRGLPKQWQLSHVTDYSHVEFRLTSESANPLRKLPSLAINFSADRQANSGTRKPVLN